ncbi:MAG: S8 family serine peptidase [Terrimicrobiaceae bacterium]
MKQKHIILRSPRAATRDVFRGGATVFGSLETPPAEVTIEIEEISNREIKALANEADVVCIAPPMPMKLIEPFAADGQAQPAAGTPTWGVNAVGASTSPFTGNGVVVAVLDTGIDPGHPAFAGVTLVQKNFTAAGPNDQHGHGTHCAGTIFGRDVDGTRIGVAPGVKKALIGKVLGTGGGSSDQIADAINWAVENGANVISMSLGIDFPGFVKVLENNGFPTEAAVTRALEGYRANVMLFQSLASLIRARGLFGQTTLIVAAAGNESRRTANPAYEIAVAPPAVAEGIVSVAALGESAAGLTAPFSNTFANVSGPGSGNLLCQAWWRPRRLERHEHGYATRCGRSRFVGGKDHVGRDLERRGVDGPANWFGHKEWTRTGVRSRRHRRWSPPSAPVLSRQ